MARSLTRPSAGGHSLAQSLAGAARVVARVLEGKSLDHALSAETQGGRLRVAIQDLAYRTLRGYGSLPSLLGRLATRPVEDPRVAALVYVSLTELRQRVAADHTVVHQAVEAAQALSVQHAAGFINAVLRKFLRGRDSLEVAPADPGTRLGYPPWWVARMLKSYPDRWEALLSLGNEHPPMTLRVNARRVSRDDYLAKLKEAKVDATPIGRDGILLARPCPVAELPGFAQGYVSVQDEGAQRAAYFLDVRPGMSVLDACAAPGGKACHVLEQVDCELVAMELSAERARRIEENLARLGLRARVVVGDARQVAQGLPDCQYDRVMLDAPCTASGVVRRHPDLRWLRRQADLVGFARMQKQLLEALWPRVRPGGKLLYATCSLFPEENGDQVVAFLARHSEATREPLPDGEDGQLLPTHDHDGFYYALLRKDR